MPETIPFRLTAWLAWTRVRSSFMNAVMAAGIPAVAVVVGVKDSFEAAMRAFLLLFPYVFLFLSRDAVRTELRDGTLDSVLFLDGGFRRHLWRKALVLAGIGSVYAVAAFAGLAAWGWVQGRFTPDMALRFAAGLAVGFYYAAAACGLSFGLDAGANSLVVIVGQIGVLISLFVAATQKMPFIEYVESGRFPDLVSRGAFLLMIAVFPNITVLPRFRGYIPEVLVLAAVSFGVLRMLSSRAEVKR